jgi:hypothetical protein
MKLDSRGLAAASRVFHEWLDAEADLQHAYICRFPDGRISLEMEWLDITAMTQAIVLAYIAQLEQPDAPTGTQE